MAQNINLNFVAPITPKYRETFYSSIPVSWADSPQKCITCLPCGRDTFSAPNIVPLTVQGKTVIGNPS